MGADSSPAASVKEIAQAKLAAWEKIAAIAAAFCLVLAIGLLAGHILAKANDPLKSTRLKQYKQQLQQDPLNETVKVRIRDLDLELRQSYFRQLSRKHSGVLLLLGGLAVFVLAVTRVMHYQHRLPMPGRAGAGVDPQHGGRLGRWSVAGSGVLIAGGLLVIAGSFRPMAPQTAAQIDKLLGGPATAVAAAPDAATPEELRLNWPVFRGLNGGSVCQASNLPARWDAASGTGIAWKVPSPSKGYNSPLIWGEKVFFSGGTAEKLEVVCLDLKSGVTLWQQGLGKVPGSPAAPAEVPESTGLAAPTMATDGRRVYVLFADGSAGAFTLEGKLVWSKSFGALKNAYGHAISLATWQDRLIVQLDQGEAEQGLSRLYALDGKTGQAVWQKLRKLGSSWASPIVIEAAGKPQIITLSVPYVIAYNARDGNEMWKVDCLNGEVTPSPVFAGGHVIVASPSEKILAIRPDGQGDVSKTHVVWTIEEGAPDVTSPASNGELVFAVTTSGLLTCIDSQNGKKVWDHELDMECHSSPVIAQGQVFLFGQKGRAVVLNAGREYKEIFRAEMADAFHATPAVAAGRMVVRGEKNIWCLGTGSPAAKP